MTGYAEFGCTIYLVQILCNVIGKDVYRFSGFQALNPLSMISPNLSDTFWLRELI